jgi:S1-C subfamily serine protease
MQLIARATPTLGLTLRDVPVASGPDGRTQVVAQVVQVDPGSYADRAGLAAGDLIVQADGIPMPTTAQVAQSFQDGGALLLIRRSGGSFFAALRR